jgi:hypothetical protein
MAEGLFRLSVLKHTSGNETSPGHGADGVLYISPRSIGKKALQKKEFLWLLEYHGFKLQHVSQRLEFGN